MKCRFVLRSIAVAVAVSGYVGVNADRALAADPTVFGIITTQAGKVPEVHLNEDVRLRIIDGDMPADAKKIRLRIEGKPLAADPVILEREVLFRLARTGADAGVWSEILGPALDKRKTVLVGLEVNGAPLKYRDQKAAGADESPQQKIEFVPAEISAFALLGNEKNATDVRLNEKLRVRVDGDGAIDETKMQLRIDGDLLNVQPRLLDGRVLVFPLERNDKNRGLWSRLLGSPFDARTPVQVSLESNGKPLKYLPPSDKDAKDAKTPTISVIAYYNGWVTTGGVILALAAILGTILLCIYRPLIRDAVVPQMPMADRPFSLGRFQMAIWFCLILSSFLLIFAVTSDLNSITAESFMLLGISGTTALAAVAIDRNKSDQIDPIRDDLVAMGLRTADDVAAVKVEAGKNPTALASTVIPGAVIPLRAAGPSVNARPAIPNPTVQQLLDAYKETVSRIKSRSFLEDLVNDDKGPAIHRWQILIWTFVLAAIYLGKVYTNLETPTFGSNLLALMGIAGGTYLGFKIPEKQT